MGVRDSLIGGSDIVCLCIVEHKYAMMFGTIARAPSAHEDRFDRLAVAIRFARIVPQHHFTYP